MAEEAKVAVRSVRRDGIDEFKTKQKNSEITEDDLKVAESEIQKLNRCENCRYRCNFRERKKKKLCQFNIKENSNEYRKNA